DGFWRPGCRGGGFTSNASPFESSLLADSFAGRGQGEPVDDAGGGVDRARDRALAHREGLEADALRVDRRLVEAVDVRHRVVHLEPLARLPALDRPEREDGGHLLVVEPDRDAERLPALVLVEPERLLAEIRVGDRADPVVR